MIYYQTLSFQRKKEALKAAAVEAKKNETWQNLQFINRKWQKFSLFDSAKKYIARNLGWVSRKTNVIHLAKFCQEF